MTINGWDFTSSEVEQLARVIHAVQQAGGQPDCTPVETFLYFVRNHYSVDEIVAIVCTNLPVDGKPEEWARNGAVTH